MTGSASFSSGDCFTVVYHQLVIGGPFVLLNDSNWFPFGSPPNLLSSSITFADFNGDGQVDFVICGQGCTIAEEYRRCHFYFRNDSGSFLDVVNSTTIFPDGHALAFDSAAINPGDINDDGRTDFIVSGTKTRPGGVFSASYVYINGCPSNATACEFQCSPRSIVNNASVCEPCTLPQVPNTEKTLCVPCPAGEIPNSERTGCVACAANAVPAPDGLTCEPCVPPQVPNELGSACELCPDGQVPDSTNISCTPCQPNEIADGLACARCNIDKVPNEQQTACEQCLDGKVADADGLVCVTAAGSSSSEAALPLPAILAIAIGGGGALLAVLLLAAIAVLCLVALCLVLCVSLACVAFICVVGPAALGGTAVFGLGGMALAWRKIRRNDASVLDENWGENESEVDMDEVRARMEFVKEVQVLRREDIVLGRKLGEGAFGDVFEATLGDQRVAFKHLREVSAEAAADFKREADTMASLSQHPYVVQMVGVVLDGETALVLEFCEGGSLESALVRRQLTERQKKRVLMQAATGLAFLHSNSIIHRDVAARNVLLGGDGRARIADFGLSRIFGSEAEAYARTLSMVGPVRWMAPEAIMDRKYSAATDAWSLGVLMWEVWSDGERPYAAYDTVGQVVTAVVTKGERLRPPISCPPSHLTLMLTLMSFDPVNRPSLSKVSQTIDEDLNGRESYSSVSSLSEYVKSPDLADDYVGADYVPMSPWDL